MKSTNFQIRAGSTRDRRVDVRGALTPPSGAPPQPLRKDSLTLANRLHDTVVQRLSAVSLRLSTDGDLDRAAKLQCYQDVRSALEDLRQAIEGLATNDFDGLDAIETEIEALETERPGVSIEISDALAAAGERSDLVASFLTEGLRNARKHSRPSRVVATASRDEGVNVIRLLNDGVGGPSNRGCGIGLRLLSTEASFAGCLTSSGPDIQEGWWELRLAMPTES